MKSIKIKSVNSTGHSSRIEFISCPTVRINFQLFVVAFVQSMLVLLLLQQNQAVFDNGQEIKIGLELVPCYSDELNW